MKICPFILIIFVLSSPVFSKNEDRLKQINDEINKIELKIRNLKREGTSVLNELYKIELEYKKAASERKKIELNLDSTKKEIAEKRREKKRLEFNIEGIKQRVKKVLRILYKRGRVGNFKIFFNVKNIDQLFKNYQLFISLIRYNLDKIDEIKNLIISLNLIEAKLKTELKKQLILRNNRNKKLKEISEIRSRKLDFVSKINSDRKKFLSMISDLKKEAVKLNSIIKHESGKAELPVIDLNKIKGRLNWPVKGVVHTRFGKTKSTRFNTYIFNNGIEIKPGGSDRIKSVFPGIIIFQNYFKGYGNIIIVQHSNDFLTIYGHCERFLKNKGDFVSGGDVIGVVGDTGSTSGKSLYFEIRRRTKAENPIKWLKKAD